MAIAIAREGGIGVIHKNMTIDEQVEKVKKVKRSESGMILDPVTLKLSSIVLDAKTNMEKYSIGGIPIINDKGFLKGIVTNRDLRFERNNERSITEVMTSKNLITVKEGTSLEDAEEILQKHKIEKLPVIDNIGKLVGLITFRDITKHSTKPIANKDKYGRLKVAAAVGVSGDVLKRTKALIEAQVDCIVIDTAHGHSKGVASILQKIKKEFKDIDVVVGNIATAEAATAIYNSGADILKVGIGPGSICTTRMVAGIGVPQITAIMNVKSVLKNKKIKIISDGGIKFSGDIIKAIAAGADAIMMGSIFAGTEESPGKKFKIGKKFYKLYRGMGSIGAMSSGSSERYFQKKQKDKSKYVPEGVESRVEYKGSVKDIIFQLQGGLRSSMGYIGAKKINEINKKSKFIKITKAGFYESMVHSVEIIGSAVNYKL